MCNNYIKDRRKWTEVYCYKDFMLQTVWGVCVCVFSCVWLIATPWTIAHQAPLSMEFSRQEHASELLFPTPGDCPNPGIELMSLASLALACGFFITEPLRSPMWYNYLETKCDKLKTYNVNPKAITIK